MTQPIDTTPAALLALATEVDCISDLTRRGKYGDARAVATFLDDVSERLRALAAPPPPAPQADALRQALLKYGQHCFGCHAIPVTIEGPGASFTGVGPCNCGLSTALEADHG